MQMKTLGLIFGFYILLLAIYPAFAINRGKARIFQSSESGCHNTKNQCKDKGDTKNRSKSPCTPMFMCQKIQLTFHQADDIQLPVPKRKEAFFEYNEIFPSIYLFATWHPPRV